MVRVEVFLDETKQRVNSGWIASYLKRFSWRLDAVRRCFGDKKALRDQFQSTFMFPCTQWRHLSTRKCYYIAKQLRGAGTMFVLTAF